ncbi:MAG: T9SS type A sorting domain-containing protein [Paludibacteraceae bacterium]
MLASFPTLMFSQLMLKENGRFGLGTNEPRFAIDVVTSGAYSDSIMFGKQSVGDRLLIRLQPSLKENGVDYSGVAISPLCYPYSSFLGTSDKRWGDLYLMQNPNVLSDSRFLMNVTGMSSGIADRFLRVRPVFANMKDTMMGYSLRGESREQREPMPVFVAQDLQLEFPDLVVNENGIYGIRYASMIPYLVQAIREQQEKITKLNAEVELLKKKSSALEKDPTVSVVRVTASYQDVRLDQNVPNPFTSQTEVDMYIPKTVTKALLCVYDLNGTQLKSYRINEKEDTFVSINKSDFRAGIYIYALICDEELVDSKEMIIID